MSLAGNPIGFMEAKIEMYMQLTIGLDLWSHHMKVQPDLLCHCASKLFPVPVFDRHIFFRCYPSFLRIESVEACCIFHVSCVTC